MQFRNRRYLLSGAAILVTVLLAAFRIETGHVSAQTASTVTIRQSATFGGYLADTAGKTLYTLSSDPAGQSTCTGACPTAWPPLTVTGQPVAPAGLTGTLGAFARSDGGQQVTYNGQALYTFVRDANAGDTNGEGATAFGGTWHVARVAGATAPAAVGATAAAPAGPTTAQRAAAAPAPAPAPAPARALPATGSGGVRGSDSTESQVELLAAASLLLLVALGLHRRSQSR